LFSFKVKCTFALCSVGVVGNVGGGSISGTSLVLSLGGSTVGTGSLEEGSLGSWDIASLTLPGLKDGLLEGTSVRESKSPWSSDVLDLVHGIEVKGSGLLRLTSGKEGDSWESWHDGAGEGADGHPGNLLWGSLLVAGSSLSDHVWLEEGSLNDKVVVKHGLHDGAENVLRNSSASLDIVASVGEDLWLNDWHKTVLLADSSVSGESVGGLSDRELTWHTVTNLEDSSPLGEAAALVIERLSTASKSIKTLSGVLPVGSWKDNKSLIELNTGVDSLGSKELNKVSSISSSLVDSLLEHDDSGNVLLNSLSGEKELTVSSSVSLGVLNSNSIESLSDGSGGFISSEDTLSWGTDLTGGLDKFVLVWVSSSRNHLSSL